MASNGTISHAEMWDDSALVDSWNEAVEEYKKYHSIKARGENADEVLSAAEAEGKSSSLAEITVAEGEYAENTIDDQRAKANTSGKTADHDTITSQKLTQSNNNVRSGPAQALGGPPALPQHLIGQVQDEGFKNLLMSWYYAGYYTGLYEGQQQDRAGSSAKNEA